MLRVLPCYFFQVPVESIDRRPGALLMHRIVNGVMRGVSNGAAEEAAAP